MSRRAPRPLAVALDRLTSTLVPASTLGRVQEVWAEVAGPAVAAAANPVSERAGVLTITCQAAVWAQELDLMSAQLIPRLNAALGAEQIRELRCRTV
jgi:predicted nucleic acid-binding Zn ribbon protein